MVGRTDAASCCGSPICKGLSSYLTVSAICVIILDMEIMFNINSRSGNLKLRNASAETVISYLNHYIAPEFGRKIENLRVTNKATGVQSDADLWLEAHA